jgi:hypothetical protein
MRRTRGDAGLRLLRAAEVPLFFLVAVLFRVEDWVEVWVEDEVED